MPLVNVMVNGRAYTIACDEGEEEHLKTLADHVDAKVRELLSSVGQLNDQRMLLMAAILIADELQDATERLQAREKEIGELSRSVRATDEDRDQSEAIAADSLESAAERLEDIAARLARA